MQEGSSLRVVVNLVQLNVAVTDKNGNYITGLHPEDFVITEDGITEKLAAFAQGDAPARSVPEANNGPAESTTGHSTDHVADQPETLSSLIAGLVSRAPTPEENLVVCKRYPLRVRTLYFFA